MLKFNISIVKFITQTFIEVLKMCAYKVVQIS